MSIKCLLGNHDWETYCTFPNEEIKMADNMRECKRCGKKEPI